MEWCNIKHSYPKQYWNKVKLKRPPKPIEVSRECFKEVYASLLCPNVLSGDLTHLLNSAIHVDSIDKDFTFVEIGSQINHLKCGKAARL